jgi:hypothetical protein
MQLFMKNTINYATISPMEVRTIREQHCMLAPAATNASLSEYPH